MPDASQTADARELAMLVKRMRDAQKRFFGGDRSANQVRIAKDWERRVDRAVADALDDQPQLFS